MNTFILLLLPVITLSGQWVEADSTPREEIRNSGRPELDRLYELNCIEHMTMDENGRPIRLSGRMYPDPEVDTPVAAVMSFLNDHHWIIDDYYPSLEFAIDTTQPASTHNGRTTVHLYQHIETIPVYRGYLNASVDSSFVIRWLNIKYFPELANTTVPDITVDEALTYLNSARDPDKEAFSLHDSKLIFLPQDNQLRLCWWLRVRSERESWEIFVDANTCKELNRVNLIVGQRFPMPNPKED